MSIVIKSNNLYSGKGYLPSVAQLSTTQDAVYNAYIARVAADGGTINSIVKIREAIAFIFDKALYGRLGVSASPHFAYKLDATGGVAKLYSIHGDDLEGIKLNGGTLPKITANNFVNFNDGMPASNIGGILSTPYRTWSERGGISIAIASRDYVNTGITPAVGISLHDKSTVTKDWLTYYTAASSNQTATLRFSTVSYGSTVFDNKTASQLASGTNGAVLFAYDATTPSVELRIHGDVQGNKIPTINMPEIYKNKHHIDFGGIWRGEQQFSSGIKISAMWVGLDLSDGQKSELNRFIENNYM